MKKIVMCGVWHVHAPDYYNYAHDLVDIIGAYDEDPEKLAAFCEKFPVKPFASFEELLASGGVYYKLFTLQSEAMKKVLSGM